MLNIASLFVGVFGLLLAMAGLIPFFGVLNWFFLPVPVVGLALGALSKRTSGRNLNIAVLLVMVLRLMLGGGIL